MKLIIYDKLVFFKRRYYIICNDEFDIFNNNILITNVIKYSNIDTINFYKTLIECNGKLKSQKCYFEKLSSAIDFLEKLKSINVLMTISQ